MKIIIPVADLHIGGGCKVLVDIAGALTDRGHDVEIVIPQSGTVKYKIPCKLTVVPTLEKSYIPYGDIILPNFYTTFSPAFEAWPDQVVRLSLGFEPLWVPKRELALWTYAQDVPIISISSWLDQQIYNHVGRRSTIVSLGVDPRVFYAKQGSERKSSADKPSIIMYIARDPKAGYGLKGLDDFIAGMHIVQNEWRGSFLVYMICPDKRELPLTNIPYRTFFPENESDMADLYRSADVFVSSSWFEAFSLPPLEAMACGTPVVTTDSGGIMDFCSPLENAYITRPRDPRGLAQGICAVLSDPHLSRKLALGGKASAARLTKAKFERNIVAALENIVMSRTGQK